MDGVVIDMDELIVINNSDNRALKDILDEINEEASALPYAEHRMIQEDLATIFNRYEDAISVVRCKDCAFREVLKYCPVVRNWVPDDFYCAYGERKDGKKDDKS